MLGAGTQGWHAAVIGKLDVPVPFDLLQFVARLERQRRRPIRLRPFSFGPGGPCGLWIGTADADHIFHETSTTPFHATQHRRPPVRAHAARPRRHGSLGWLIALLAPDVDQALIQLILGRTAYGTEQEQEAETLAYLILSGPARVRPGSSLSICPGEDAEPAATGRGCRPRRSMGLVLRPNGLTSSP